MKRAVLSGIGLLIAILVVGCTKSPTPPSKTPPKTPPATSGGAKESVAADTAKDLPKSAPAVPAPDTAAADTTNETPAADTKGMDTPAADAAAEPAKSDVTPPADAAAAKLPFADLLAVLGNAEATQVYGDIEKQLAENPEDLMARVQRAWFLNRVGSELIKADKRDKGLEAYGVALEQAQAVVAKEPSLPEQFSQVLGMIYYGGACAQSLGGKPEDARATLVKAVELGFNNLNAIKMNEDLAAVRALAGFDQQLEAWIVAEAREALATGESFPFDFTLTDVSGQNISLAGYQGKVLIVNIWGTWCPPCREEIPSLVKLQAEYGPQGLQIVGLNYENADNDAAAQEGVQKFMQENGMNYPCAMGTQAVQQQVPNFEPFPTTLFIDRTGKVRAKVESAQEYVFFETIVKALLEEAAPPPADPAATPPAATPATSVPPAAPDASPPPADPAATPDAGVPPAAPDAGTPPPTPEPAK